MSEWVPACRYAQSIGSNPSRFSSFAKARKKKGAPLPRWLRRTTKWEICPTLYTEEQKKKESLKQELENLLFAAAEARLSSGIRRELGFHKCSSLTMLAGSKRSWLSVEELERRIEIVKKHMRRDNTAASGGGTPSAARACSAGGDT